MKKVGAYAFAVAFGLHAGIFAWDFIALPLIGRYINKRYVPWRD